jgi:mono/diheme cytochrome c family protein
MKALLVGLVAFGAIAQAHDISSQVTWSREVSRLLDRHCTSCHHDGGSAFGLTNFLAAQAHAKDIAKAVLDRRMPPFGAVKGFGDLRDDRSLTQEQIGLVISWVQGGSPEGDESLAPKGPAKHAAPANPEPKTGAEWIGGAKKLEADTTFVAIRPKTLPGDSVRVIAELPDGTVDPLIWFYHCDPKTAATYYFRKPIRLPAGTKIVASVPDVSVALLEPAR